MKYIELVTWNRKMLLMYGDKLTRTQKAIGHRSNGLHTAIRFSDRYGRISWTCTTAGGMDGCGFINSQYSHPYRQSRVRIAVTEEQEFNLFRKACDLADEVNGYVQGLAVGDLLAPGECIYGSDHIKYDINGARFAFILKWNWWKMHRVKMICNEACANVLLEVWPNLLVIQKEEDVAMMCFDIAVDDNGVESTHSYIRQNRLDPATLTPDQFEYQVRYYFEQADRPNQQDIDNIIKEVNG